MYLFRPDHWFKRAEVSGEGAKLGSSDEGTVGSRVSGSTGSILRSGSTVSGQSTRVIPANQLGTSIKGPMISRPPSSAYGGRHGPSRPLLASYAVLFGFWPLAWVADYPAGSLPNNHTRPGGTLISAAITPPAPIANITYVIYGDQQSVEYLLPTLIGSCSAIGASPGINATANSTVQMYREDSFELLATGTEDAVQTGRNFTFEMCLNQTILENILVVENSILPQQASPEPSGNNTSTMKPALPIETNENFFWWLVGALSLCEVFGCESKKSAAISTISYIGATWVIVIAGVLFAQL